METKKAIQISFVIFMIGLVLALIYALAAFIKPELLVSRSFQLYTGLQWDNLLNESPNVAHYTLILERMAGGLGLATVAGGFFVLFTAFRKGEKWAWYFMLVVSLIGWGNNLLGNIIMKNTLVIIIILVGILTLIAGLIISSKVFLCEKKSA
jgi:uncharacterized membrane protein (DUF485 family)